MRWYLLTLMHLIILLVLSQLVLFQSSNPQVNRYAILSRCNMYLTFVHLDSKAYYIRLNINLIGGTKMVYMMSFFNFREMFL